MLIPSKTKYRKQHRARGKGFAGLTKAGSELCFGGVGLKAVESGEINSRQLEAARRVITRTIKRGGKVWIRIFPNKAITKKAAEVPMGSGKGSVEYYAFVVKPGRILFEMDGVNEAAAAEALALAGYKLPVKCKVVTKNN
ncbi:MAG: 50S ribosomal protein L16, large subunit ribosomal protein L16 [Candidatus Peregrinibacteria bacterium GW2011_GWF2_33_10]|nr:MAG: 50S ribosomal protein L16, large subunit ribosomal protein L16 [Candidatus Peregrinibacteria bacterium GW2011_GWF2_33_10]OGJ46130.1 MAG: 50S ribosomal protein L16 [Candidatus Peregrinibacteria bacterium RIFOXYA12_FULL_33_12]OGJ46164.1 MAG: 50S ribosomal protein L16 [Candidatus Peregrinibacteria bacterium RIFOXYA2_FULL_33_21]OGJ51581.1 MAG: 50S ribosomal protein L16 [Candidatus Peregrinibacteria bacterium RIFOXYB2_FULL_33_20]